MQYFFDCKFTFSKEKVAKSKLLFIFATKLEKENNIYFFKSIKIINLKNLSK
ncbi:hypothetical protein HMPREF9072_00467 [Capnocytophaga sp. oral taxon 324 str. F0483]|nr:hypothetical protein HMPREF9072_00467 [Capnocytophaga sp. oral taxon 324 str. F0483]